MSKLTMMLSAGATATLNLYVSLGPWHIALTLLGFAILLMLLFSIASAQERDGRTERE